MKDYYFSVIKFPVFVSLSILILVGLFFGMAIASYGQTGLGAWETVLYTTIFIALIFLVFNWVLVLISTHTVIKPPWIKRFSAWMLFNIYYTLAKTINTITFGKKTGLQESFLNLNNEIVICNYSPIKDPSILVLLPHCLQNSECKIRITADIEACAECGKCDIATAKQVLGKYPVKTAVATGGSLARKLIIDNHPDVIVAVACHRDLTEGVRDSWRFPVFAVLNERPNGPCFETTVSIPTLEFAIKRFLR